MKLHSKTLFLFLVAAVLFALNILDSGETAPGDSGLPSLPALSIKEIRRAELSSAGEKIVLEKEESGWNIVSPVEDRADQARVKAMILNFRKEIPMDVMVEKGNLEAYGLDASNGIVVEFWGSESEPKISMTIGFDAASGTTFLRLSGDNSVYRARIGGRHRYAHKGGAWRNQVLLDYKVSEIRSVDFKLKGEESYTLSQDDQQKWSISPAPDWEVDQDLVGKTLARLGRLRIGSRLDRDLKSQDLQMTIQKKQGPPVELTVEFGTSALVKMDGSKTKFQTAVNGFSAFLTMESFRDRNVFSFQPRESLDTVSYQSAGRKVVIQQDISNGFWTVIEPTGVDLEIKNLFFFVNTMAGLTGTQVLSELPQGSRLRAPDVTLDLRFLNRTESKLSLWKDEHPVSQKKILVGMKSGDPRIFVLPDTFLEKINQAFGRTD